MNLDIQKIAEYEIVIPKCVEALSGVMPGLEAVIRDDVVMSYSRDYPSPDTNHAILLRESPEKIDDLIDEVIAYYKERDLPATIMLSPACTPADLPQRLLKRGFIKQEPDECWLVMEDFQHYRIPKTDPKTLIKSVQKEDLHVFAETMVAAYEMTQEWIPMLENVLEPSIGHPNINHYLAYVDQKPAATFTTMMYKEYVVMGSGGILPKYRGSRLIHNIGVTALALARDKGADTILGQTVVGPLFERFLRFYGFKQAFRRQAYILE
jgi:hypothetical protein